MAYIPGTRGLQKIWIPQQGLWVLVWCHDDGDLDVNSRLCYSVCSSPAEFYEPSGQFVLARNTAGDFNYVYGVPYAIEAHKGIVKVLYTDLNTSLAWPRMATGETEPSDTPGKDPNPGNALEGYFLSGDSTNGPIFWGIKNYGWHNNPGHVLEATDIGDPQFQEGSGQGCSAPTGTMLVEYQRDSAGRIITDDGMPMLALIDNEQ